MQMIPEGLLERAAARWHYDQFVDVRNGLRRRAGALLTVDLESPDEPGTLSAAMQRVRDMDLQAASHAARAQAKRLDWNEIGDQIAALYRGAGDSR